MREKLLPKCPEELEIYGDEPDQLQGEAHGFPYEIRRHEFLGHLCGYVDLPIDHPWAKCEEYNIDCHVHGGITFGPTPRENHATVRIGFDCAHYLDYSPGMLRYKKLGLGTKIGNETYKTMEFVKGQCEDLCQQAKQAAKKE